MSQIALLRWRVLVLSRKSQTSLSVITNSGTVLRKIRSYIRLLVEKSVIARI